MPHIALPPSFLSAPYEGAALLLPLREDADTHGEQRGVLPHGSHLQIQDRELCLQQQFKGFRGESPEIKGSVQRVQER